VVGAAAAVGDPARAAAVAPTPDVVWMGVQVGGLAGTRLIASIHELVPATRFVVVCGPEDTEVRARALRVGAVGFVRREEAPGLAVEVTESVAWGRPWLERRDVESLRAAYLQMASRAGSVQEQVAPPALDDSLRAVLDGLASGGDPAGVAADLGLSEAAVHGAVASALERLHRHSRTEAMAYALDERVFEQG
jgi:DNA-binding NarL/FixJ family response regulator